MSIPRHRQAWLNLACIALDIRTGRFRNIPFHLLGLIRSLPMLEKLTQYGSITAFSSGSFGIAMLMTLVHQAVSIIQLILLGLSLISVCIGIYIALPQFKAKWRKHGGLKLFLPSKGSDGENQA